MVLTEIREQARRAAGQLVQAARLQPGMLLVVGCSSSEIGGKRIGTTSSLELAQAAFDAMGDEKLTITGTGAFFGDDAFVQFKKLAKLFKETTPGNLEHPIWGIRYCYLTGLEMTQEPKDNYVSYRFTFTGAQTNGVVPR
mgnify:CR=1 FL=1